MGVSIWPWPPATHSTPTMSTMKKINPVLLLILILFSLSQACSNSLFSTPATTYNVPSQQNSSQPPLQGSHSNLFYDNLFMDSSNTPGGRNRLPVQPSSEAKINLFINQPSINSETSLFINHDQHKPSQPGGRNRPPVQPSSKDNVTSLINRPSINSETGLFITKVQHNPSQPGGRNQPPALPSLSKISSSTYREQVNKFQQNTNPERSPAAAHLTQMLWRFNLAGLVPTTPQLLQSVRHATPTRIQKNPAHLTQSSSKPAQLTLYKSSSTLTCHLPPPT